MAVRTPNEIEKGLADYRKAMGAEEIPMRETALRQTQISKECTHLANEIDRLHEVVSHLEDRLSSVLRYSDPKPENVEKAESLVQHAEYIRGRAWEVATATERIADILQRLEL